MSAEYGRWTDRFQFCQSVLGTSTTTAALREAARPGRESRLCTLVYAALDQSRRSSPPRRKLDARRPRRPTQPQLTFAGDPRPAGEPKPARSPARAAAVRFPASSSARSRASPARSSSGWSRAKPLEVARLAVPGRVDDLLRIRRRARRASRPRGRGTRPRSGGRPGSSASSSSQRRVRLEHPGARAREVVRQPHVRDVLAREDHQREAAAGAQDALRLGERRGRVLDVVEHRDEHHGVDARRRPAAAAARRPGRSRGPSRRRARASPARGRRPPGPSPRRAARASSCRCRRRCRPAAVPGAPASASRSGPSTDGLAAASRRTCAPGSSSRAARTSLIRRYRSRDGRAHSVRA